MIRVGPRGLGAEWDIASAYKVIWFHPSNVDLTQSFIPDFGYVYQATGAFGAAPCGCCFFLRILRQRRHGSRRKGPFSERPPGGCLLHTI